MTIDPYERVHVFSRLLRGDCSCHTYKCLNGARQTDQAVRRNRLAILLYVRRP